MKALLIALCILVAGCSDQKEGADVLIYGGRIYTVNNAEPLVEAVAVKDGKVLYAGHEAGARLLTDGKTKVINLQGRTMTPGFIEGHGHLMGVGHNEVELDLMAVRSYDELVEQVKVAVSKAKPGEWIQGRGWHQDKWDHLPDTMVKGFQTHHRLSAVSPDNPVFLRHASGHAAIANAKAMEIAGVNQLSREAATVGDSQGGEIIRDALGNPTGIFNEKAMGLISQHIPPHSAATNTRALQLALEACHRNGITGFHDAGATQESIDLFRRFRREGKLNLRLYVMLGGAALARDWMTRGPELDPEQKLTIRAIKLSCDGALGSRGAWLLEPYADRPDFSGMATIAMDTVLAIARAGLRHGFQVCSHAIGDRANREVLNQYEIALKENPAKAQDHRFRIEHAQHLHPDDIARFAALGVIPAMQAIHMSSDRPWAIERLGKKRIEEGAYMWQSLLKSGARIVNGTDAPVEPLNPIASFYASVTRKTLKGEPQGGFEPDQKMTREQALRSYTLDAAYGAFQEEVLGSIEKGKFADFTIFSQDIMTVEEQRLLKTEVVMTIVDGQVVFER